jgi:hypothetical protein
MVEKLEVSGAVRVVSAEELEDAVAEGWVLQSAFTEDVLTPTYEVIANPEYQQDEYGNPRDYNKPATIEVRKGDVSRQVTKFIVSMDQESVAAKTHAEAKELRIKIHELEKVHGEEKAALEGKVHKLEADLVVEAGRTESLEAKVRRAEEGRHKAENSQADTITANSRLREFLVVLWSEVGNAKMRTVLGSRYPAELEDQTIPAQMAKNFYEHLLEEADDSAF